MFKGLNAAENKFSNKHEHTVRRNNENKARHKSQI